MTVIKHGKFVLSLPSGCCVSSFYAGWCWLYFPCPHSFFVCSVVRWWMWWRAWWLSNHLVYLNSPGNPPLTRSLYNLYSVSSCLALVFSCIILLSVVFAVWVRLFSPHSSPIILCQVQPRSFSTLILWFLKMH